MARTFTLLALLLFTITTAIAQGGYETWDSKKDRYFIDKYEVRDGYSIFYLRLVYPSGNTVAVPGPYAEAEAQWILIETNADGSTKKDARKYQPDFVKNVTVNNKVVSASIPNGGMVFVGPVPNALTPVSTVTCEVWMTKLPSDIKKLDMIEGVEGRYFDGSFSFFKVDLPYLEKKQMPDWALMNNPNHPSTMSNGGVTATTNPVPGNHSTTEAATTGTTTEAGAEEAVEEEDEWDAFAENGFERKTGKEEEAEPEEEKEMSNVELMMTDYEAYKAQFDAKPYQAKIVSKDGLPFQIWIDGKQVNAGYVTELDIELYTGTKYPVEVFVEGESNPVVEKKLFIDNGWKSGVYNFKSKKEKYGLAIQLGQLMMY